MTEQWVLKARPDKADKHSSSQTMPEARESYMRKAQARSINNPFNRTTIHSIIESVN